MAELPCSMTAMDRYSLLLLVTAAMLTLPSEAILNLEAISARGQHVISKRSNSLTGQTVSLHQGESLSLVFCLRQFTYVSVANVRYSSDGPVDTVQVSMDHQVLGGFQTHSSSDWGHNWNVFHYSGRVGNVLLLARGVHIISVYVTSGDGVEIDVIQMELSDATLTSDLLTCQLVCDGHSPFWSGIGGAAGGYNVGGGYGVGGRLAVMTVEQYSYPTQCAEEDNVKVGLFGEGVQEYMVTASHPTYSSIINRREPNNTACPFLPPQYWSFTNVSLPSYSPVILTKGAIMSFMGVPSSAMAVTFNLEGRSQGLIDADIGSLMTMVIQPRSFSVKVKMQYRDRGGKTHFTADVTFGPGDTSKQWHFPDFTWIEERENIVWMSILTPSSSDVTINELRMERRYMQPDTSFTMYKTDEVIVDGIHVDFWWRAPEAMTLRVKGGETRTDIGYFRISVPVPWTNGYAQVFVLYQDGNARLVHLPRPGLDWIPFGSSVIIGPCDPTVKRPASPIAQVDLDPTTLTLFVTFLDGTTSTLRLRVFEGRTELWVSNIRMAASPSGQRRAFATLRSMWVTDGNADCDSVQIESQPPASILDSWPAMAGKSVAFFRRCESRHLTLAPDIQFHVLRTNAWPHDSSQHWVNSFVPVMAPTSG